MKQDNLLIVAASERDADLLYATGFLVPEPVIYLRLRGKCHLVLPELEMSRGRRIARSCRVLSLDSYRRQLRTARRPRIGHGDVIRAILREHRIKKIMVPATFSLGLARSLRQLKIKVRIKDDPIFPTRQFKTSEEIKKISAALTMAEVGLAEGLLALKNAKIGRDRRLLLRNAPLTSERLRAVIDTAILQAGGLTSNTIVAGGSQACNPHEPGHGPLRAHEPIVIDVFPRSRKTGYFGDITRTVVKGRATEAVHRLYDTVRRAQEVACAALKATPPAANVHRSVLEFFNTQGFPTHSPKRLLQGLLHGVGHGIGLELHEFPSLTHHSPDRILTGHVITLEPGLYYPEVGGVRLEDVFHITARGPRNLTKFEKQLEIP